jgi:hypothetical protein
MCYNCDVIAYVSNYIFSINVFLLLSAIYVFVSLHYCYYSALGPIWAGTRAQSGDQYGSGTLHPGQVLRGSLPLLSPYFTLSIKKYVRKIMHIVNTYAYSSFHGDYTQTKFFSEVAPAS